MAEKLQHTNIAPAGNAGVAEGASVEKQTLDSSSKQDEFVLVDSRVNDTANDLGDLSLSKDEQNTVKGRQEDPDAEAVTAPVTKIHAPATITDTNGKQDAAKGPQADPDAAAISSPATTVPEASPKEDTDTVKPTTGPFWPETSPDHPLTKLYNAFEALAAEAQHAEVYGIELTKSNAFHTKLILQKFLRANQNDLEKAKQQLLETLKWRKSFDPTKAASESFDKSRFGGLGYVLEVEGVPESPNTRDVVTFNIYGAVKDKKATFGDLEGFLRWRVGLMEKSVMKLSLKDATKPIPNFGEGADPYQGFQIHDYLQISFLRQDPSNTLSSHPINFFSHGTLLLTYATDVKAATTETIKVLGRYYPETLSRKFFVNVPVVMGWVYTAVKLVVAKETAKKFTVLSYGNQLATELGKDIPEVYGGTKGELDTVAEGMNLLD
jgi:hypothetical protein